MLFFFQNYHIGRYTLANTTLAFSLRRSITIYRVTRLKSLSCWFLSFIMGMHGRGDHLRNHRFGPVATTLHIARATAERPQLTMFQHGEEGEARLITDLDHFFVDCCI